MRQSLLALFLVASIGVQAAEMTLKVRSRYLNIPISQAAERRRLTFRAEGIDELSVLVRLAEGEPDYWVFKDMEAYKGRTLTLSYEGSEAALRAILQADTIMGQAQMYREANRPQFHFTTRRGWINDPNGLIFHDGEYHLFYQHNPYEREWQNMHWGHAVSPDLLHWTELNDALYPDAAGTMFSGSAVFDAHNTSGFGTKQNPPLVFAYTNDGRHETQCLAYSLDRGRTLTKYAGNPVVDSHAKWQTHDTRDPRLLWYAPARHWVMVLNERNGHSIYTSDNLRDWSYQSHVTGFWECPDLVELPVDGNPGQTMWLLYGASGTYMLGQFDGRVFTPSSGKHCYTSGTIYAAQTITDVPDGRCIQIGWGRVSHPDMPFNGMMLLPTELTLRTTREGVRLCSRPIREVESLLLPLYSAERPLSQSMAAEALNRYADRDGLHIRCTLNLTYATSATLRLNGQTLIDYDLNQNLLNGRFYSPQRIGSLSLPVELFIDRTSVEVFVEDGLYSYSLARTLSDNREGFRFSGSELSIADLRVDGIRSIW